MVPFFDVDLLAEQVVEVLARPRRFSSLRTNARQTVITRYDSARVCLPKMMDVIRRYNKSSTFNEFRRQRFESKSRAAHGLSATS